VLYICMNALGDVITTLPSIHFLKRSDRHNVDVCVKADFTEIFLADPYVDRLISAPNSWFDIQPPSPCDQIEEITVLPEFRTHYDVIIDSMCIPQTVKLIELLKPHAATGIGFDSFLHVYDHPVTIELWKSWSEEMRTVCDCFADVVRAWHKDYTESVPVLYVSLLSQRWAVEWLANKNSRQLPLVALNPGAGYQLKCWPLSRYLELGEMLTTKGYCPLFIFGPNESALVSQASQQITDMNGICYSSPNSRVQNVAALLQQCLLTVCNDCGIMHISAAVGTRTLAIYGPSISKLWFPYHQDWNQVLELDVECRRRCSHDQCADHKCLSDISTLEVLVRALRMLPKC